MTDQQTLLRLALRCRRMAALCATEAIARKFEALAMDYEEHARQIARNRMMATQGLLSGASRQDEESLTERVATGSSRR